MPQGEEFRWRQYVQPTIPGQSDLRFAICAR
jgi:hypothetical protein